MHSFPAERRHSGRGGASSKGKASPDSSSHLRRTGTGGGSKSKATRAVWCVRRSGTGAAPLLAALDPLPRPEALGHLATAAQRGIARARRSGKALPHESIRRARAAQRHGRGSSTARRSALFPVQRLSAPSTGRPAAAHDKL
jgi:hypothetical protein